MYAKLTDKEFETFREFIKKISGIHMKPEKKILIESRLAKRLRYYNLSNYSAYFDILMKDDVEQQMFIDIITTNETSFFREHHHFEFLRDHVLANARDNVRIWSAACSIGAEAYSAAFVCDEALSARHLRYEIVCSDINTEVIKTAQIGLYPEKFISQIPQKYLKKYCLKGKGKYEGHFIIDDKIKQNLLFRRLNLLEPLPSDMGQFDLIFLRNMLIYFDASEKRKIVENVSSKLKKDGYLLIGHSETLFNITNCVKQLKPTIYTK
ncbi:MAG: protein-glutamate O-methyltransferase CheR [Campylobacteraceae bacterium]|nr:protein-glutamate O-methyltransferase CheR [Campylobacteraceae bacterium]